MKTFLIVDGYNVIHIWAEEKGIKDIRLEEARENLIEKLNSYSGFMGYETVLVFDAYSQENLKKREEIRGGIKVVFTEKNKTADAYIEKLVFSLPKLYTVKVVTSDYTIQRMVLASGGERIPSKEFLGELKNTGRKEQHYFQNKKKNDRNKLEDYMDDNVLAVMKELRKGNSED
ncbi:MAG: NYN domain-containing protein [Eubacterium sp.]